MSANKRRFELVEGSSSKFWEIAIDGASYTVTYGRIGSSGVSKTTETASAEEAAADVAKLIREKTKKGYTEPGSSAPPVFRPRRDIEKAESQPIPAVIPIIRAPDDPGVADEIRRDEFDNEMKPDGVQAGGWRGFLSRLVS